MDGHVIESETQWSAHQSTVTQIVVGSHLYTSSHDGFIKMWNSGKLIKETSCSSHVTSLCLTRCNRLFSGGADKLIHEWDPSTLEEKYVLKGSRGWILCLTCSISIPNRLFSSDTAHSIRIWDIESGIALQEFKGHTDWVYCIALHENTVYSCSKDETIRIWTCQGDLIATIDAGPVNALGIAFNNLISIGEDGLVLSWNLETLLSVKLLETCPLHALSPIGNCFIVGGDDGVAKLIVPPPQTSTSRANQSFEVDSRQNTSKEKLHFKLKGQIENLKTELSSAKSEISTLEAQLKTLRPLEAELKVAKEILEYYQIELTKTQEAHETAIGHLAFAAQRRLNETQTELAHFKSLFDSDHSGLFFHSETQNQDLPPRRVWEFDTDWDSDEDNENTWWRAPISGEPSTQDPLVVNYFCTADIPEPTWKTLDPRVSNQKTEPQRRRHSLPRLPTDKDSIQDQKRASHGQMIKGYKMNLETIDQSPQTTPDSSPKPLLLTLQKTETNKSPCPKQSDKLPKKYLSLLQEPSTIFVEKPWSALSEWFSRR